MLQLCFHKGASNVRLKIHERLTKYLSLALQRIAGIRHAKNIRGILHPNSGCRMLVTNDILNVETLVE